MKELKNIDLELVLNIQHFARKKNALTGYFVGPYNPTENTGTATLELAKWIHTVEDDSDEETEDEGFYDGDGTPETDIVSVKKVYQFEGYMDHDDPGMKFIADLEFKTGDERKIWFKQVRTDGTTLEGRATVSDIIVSGGEAVEYAAFECKIGWDSAPTITPATDPLAG